MEKINKKLIFASAAFIFILMFSFLYNLACASDITVSKVIELVNIARDKEGIYELSENATLNKIAQDKLGDMIKNNYFAHTSPKGVTPWSWYEKEKYDYKYAGENLAINFVTAESQQKAWMDSLTHKKNIMNPEFREIGVAVGAGEINNQMAIITVQEFGTLAGAAGKASNPQNFSGKEKNNIVKEETEITPTVLSVKNESNQNYPESGKNIENPSGLGKNYFSDVKDSVLGNKDAIAKALQTVSALIFVLVLVLTPMVFIFEALKTVSVYSRLKKALDSGFVIETK